MMSIAARIAGTRLAALRQTVAAVIRIASDIRSTVFLNHKDTKSQKLS